MVYLIYILLLNVLFINTITSQTTSAPDPWLVSDVTARFERISNTFFRDECEQFRMIVTWQLPTIFNQLNENFTHVQTNQQFVRYMRNYMYVGPTFSGGSHNDGEVRDITPQYIVPGSSLEHNATYRIRIGILTKNLSTSIPSRTPSVLDNIFQQQHPYTEFTIPIHLDCKSQSTQPPPLVISSTGSASSRDEPTAEPLPSDQDSWQVTSTPTVSLQLINPKQKISRSVLKRFPCSPYQMVLTWPRPAVMSRLNSAHVDPITHQQFIRYYLHYTYETASKSFSEGWSDGTIWTNTSTFIVKDIEQDAFFELQIGMITSNITLPSNTTWFPSATQFQYHNHPQSPLALFYVNCQAVDVTTLGIEVYDDEININAATSISAQSSLLSLPLTLFFMLITFF